MDVFTAIPDGLAIVHAKGIYRQVPIYTRAGKVYAKYGVGFVKLLGSGATSHPNARWVEMDCGDGSYDETSGSVNYREPTLRAA